MNAKRIVALVASSLAVVLAAGGIGSVLAQGYPSRPIRILVGFPPGGVADILARSVGSKLSESLGQPVVVENRAGAGGNIAAELLARSAPDGHSLIMFGTPTLANVFLYRKLSYDPMNEFAPVALVASMANILVVNPSVPANSVTELISLAKSKPGQLNFGSAGIGSTQHLSGQLFKSAAGIDISHIPYKGSGPAMTALLAGEIPIIFNVMSTVLPQMKAGKVRGLAVTSAKRSPFAPELPTIAEAGIPGYEYVAYFGLIAPARTPQEIIARLNAETARILQMPDIMERLAFNGAEPMIATPEQFGAFLREELTRMGKVVRESGARAD